MPFRLATWPPVSEFPRSPYLGAFYDAVKAYGVVPVTGLEPTVAWLRENRSAIDGLHIHWPDGLWRRNTKGSVTAQLRNALELRHFLREARRSGLKTIWTVHNLARHEGAGWLDRYCYSLLARRTDLFICHSHWAAAEAHAEYAPTGTIVVVPHGSFLGIFPEPRQRDVVLAELGLQADRPVVCALGHIRLYKGLDIACEAVRQLNGAVQLVVGGRPFGRLVDRAELRKSLSEANRGVLLDRELSNQEFSDIVAASEAVLLPYRTITGSGVLLAAWTLGRGVIASDLPYFREIAGGEPLAARLFSPGNAAALREAIQSYLQVPAVERNRAARRLAEAYSWDRCVKPLAPILNAWQDNRHAG